MGGDKYTSFNSIDKLKSVGFYYDRWWAGSGMTWDDSFTHLWEVPEIWARVDKNYINLLNP